MTKASGSDKDATKILLVDDDPGMLQLLGMRLSASGYQTIACGSGREALNVIKRNPPAVVITDLRMEPMDGMALFLQVQQSWPTIPVIMLTAHGSIREAVEATQQGLFSFLTKPVDKDELLRVIGQALELGCGPTHSADEGWADAMKTCSETMLHLLEQTRLLARSDINVLISGETGTGKELLAQALHRASPRADNPFVAINCGAIPEDLLESELFGHVKGAFTGATRDHEGLFVSADGGSLFLDEIGDMPASLQAKLLRVLQDKKIRPVGDTRDREINVRILSATHRNLEAAIANREFREDLYYRLNGANLSLPALRERKEDIPLLVKHFLEEIAARSGEDVRQISPHGQRLLMQYNWPGNIRQLQNVIEKIVALSPTPVIAEPLIAEALPGVESGLTVVPLNDAKRQFERDYLVQLLHMTGGNVSEAARISGRNRSDLHKIMKRHDLDSEQFKDR